MYSYHFFGHMQFREELFNSIYLHAATMNRSMRVLGDHHPLTCRINASMQLCITEQLDWTLDDFPADLRELARAYDAVA